MNVGRIAASPPPSVAADVSVQRAVRPFRNSRSGALLVLDRGRLAGVLAERDVVLRVVGRGLDPRVTKVADVMTKPVDSVRADTPVEYAFDLMSSRRIRHLAVVDDQDRPIGLLSIRAVARACLECAAEQLKTLEACVGAESAGD